MNKWKWLLLPNEYKNAGWRKPISFFLSDLVEIRVFFTEKYNISFDYLFIYINNGIFVPLL